MEAEHDPHEGLGDQWSSTDDGSPGSVQKIDTEKHNAARPNKANTEGYQQEYTQETHFKSCSLTTGSNARAR